MRTINEERRDLVIKLLWAGHSHLYIANELGLERSSISYYVKNNSDELLALVAKDSYRKAELMLKDKQTVNLIAETLGIPVSIVFLIKKKVLGFKRSRSTRVTKRKRNIKCIKCGLVFKGNSQSDCTYCNEG